MLSGQVQSFRSKCLSSGTSPYVRRCCTIDGAMDVVFACHGGARSNVQLFFNHTVVDICEDTGWGESFQVFSCFYVYTQSILVLCIR